MNEIYRYELMPTKKSPKSAIAYREIADNAQATVEQLDALIKRHAMLLEIIQPYAQGKISVRFIKAWGGAQIEPTFVAWKWTPSGRKEGKLKHYDLLPLNTVSRSIKRYGPFNGTQDDVRRLVGAIKQLMQQRKALTLLRWRFAQAISLSTRCSRQRMQTLEAALEHDMFEIHGRHAGLIKEYQARRKERLRELAEMEARGVIPDPGDFDDLYPYPETAANDDEAGVLPDSYLDEEGNYVGP